MSLITMGWGQMTVITMGLGNGIRIAKSINIMRRQSGHIQFIDEKPDIEAVDDRISITASDEKARISTETEKAEVKYE